jgi:hypothetical protein
MPISTIFSFLTYPKKSRPDETVVSGTTITPDDGKLSRMLGDIFDAAGSECNIPVMFTSDDAQANPVRTELLALLKNPSVEAAAPLASRLQQATTGKSGMGLLFTCIGPEGPHTRVVLSRFPADEGVVAERASNKLTVAFVEQVFLKSSHAYKAVTYLSDGTASELWKGHAVDKQINHGSKSMADYWIADFLKSDFATTAATGTKRLAQALKSVMDSSADVDVKKEITAAVHLAANIPGKALTILEFCDSFNFSPKTRDAVAAKVSPSRLVNDKFKFDNNEFSKHIAYKQIELDNGAVLSAPADKFDDCFKSSINRGAQMHAAQTFSTTGVVVHERLKMTK